MTIQKDAGDLLIYIYQQYIKDANIPEIGKIMSDNQWDSKRTERAIKYLSDKGFIDMMYFATDDLGITNIFAKGIDVIENKNKFQSEFGFEINLGLLKLNVKSKKK